MPEVLVTVSGLTGSGKSSVASEIDIALRSIGVRTTWADGGHERSGVPADLLDPGAAADLTVTIREVNIPRIPTGHFGSNTLANSKAPD
jgi:adenylylsulfate kinase-like enzyme